MQEFQAIVDVTTTQPITTETIEKTINQSVSDFHGGNAEVGSVIKTGEQSFVVTVNITINTLHRVEEKEVLEELMPYLQETQNLIVTNPILSERD